MRTTLLALLFLTPLALPAAAINPEMPDSWPVCTAPQPVAPLQPGGGQNMYAYARWGIAWNPVWAIDGRGLVTFGL